MALTVRDLMKLQCFNYLELIAGQKDWNVRFPAWAL